MKLESLLRASWIDITLYTWEHFRSGSVINWVTHMWVLITQPGLLLKELTKCFNFVKRVYLLTVNKYNSNVRSTFTRYQSECERCSLWIGLQCLYKFGMHHLLFLRSNADWASLITQSIPRHTNTIRAGDLVSSVASWFTPHFLSLLILVIRVMKEETNTSCHQVLESAINTVSREYC